MRSTPLPHSLDLLADPLAVCRLAADAPVPPWALDGGGGFVSITRTADELSVVCACTAVPDGVTVSTPWRALRVAGPLDLGEVGVLAALGGTLAAAGVSVFPVATYDTDYLLVREGALSTAVAALRGAGHTVRA